MTSGVTIAKTVAGNEQNMPARTGIRTPSGRAECQPVASHSRVTSSGIRQAIPPRASNTARVFGDGRASASRPPSQLPRAIPERQTPIVAVQVSTDEPTNGAR